MNFNRDRKVNYSMALMGLLCALMGTKASAGTTAYPGHLKTSGCCINIDL